MRRLKQKSMDLNFHFEDILKQRRKENVILGKKLIVN